MPTFINKEETLSYLHGDYRDYEIVEHSPAADVEPVRHAYWVKRMEERKGRGYKAHTPVWSCSHCGKDYDPATCSIIKYCFECGAKMDGGQEPPKEEA